MKTEWDERYARRTKRMKGSAIRELLKVTEIPGTISLAGGLPAGEFFPSETIAAVTQRILLENGEKALQYSSTEGYLPLRELLAEQLTRGGVRASVENILITSGSQQALDLLGKILIDVDDPIVVESPTYLGALQACNPYEPTYIAVRSDAEGIVTEELEPVLTSNPRFIYALPNFQNPTGITFSLERRKQLVEMAGRRGIPIIEDDPYSQLRFEGEPLPSLLALEDERQRREGEVALDDVYEGNVIQLNTFSKVLAPGLRIGWVVAAPEVIRRLVLAKQGADLHTASLNQMIAYEMMQQGYIEQQIPLIRRGYRERRDVMLAALEESFPDTVSWTRPQGGMFLWVTLPEGVDSAQLLNDALEYRIAFVPGEAFHANGGGKNTMRLNFSNASPERIEEGMRRLGRLLHDRMLRA